MESQHLISALLAMVQSTVLQHPRLAVPDTRSPPKLWFPARKRKHKFDQAAELRAEHALVTEVHKAQGWNVIYPNGSSEMHPVVGRVGGFGIIFGDERDLAACIPLNEDQTNIQAELHASLKALEGTGGPLARGTIANLPRLHAHC